MKYKSTLRALLALVFALILSGCTGVTDTRLAPSVGRPTLTNLVILIDKDVIGGAFASYKSSGALLTGMRRGNYQGFIDNLQAGLMSEAATAGVEVDIEIVSMQSNSSLPVFFNRGKPILTIRALSYTTLKRVVGNQDMGWSGDSAWEFSLMEKTSTAAYAKTWIAGVKNENLNPALCGSYENCSRALANRVFVQMRKDGVVK